MGLIIILSLGSRNLKRIKSRLGASPIVWTVFVWWALHSLGWIYANDHARAFEFWKKASYLALIPLFMITIRAVVLKQALGAFLLGLTAYHFIVHAMQLGWLQFEVLQVGGTPFIARIHYSPMLLFGILLLVQWQRSWKGIKKGLAWVLIGSFFVSLISTEGRTGQILFALIIPFWVLMETRRGGLFLLICLMFFIVGSTLFFSFDRFSNRYTQIKKEWDAFQDGNIYTSMGQRFHHYQVAWKIFKKSAVWGHGTGSYRKEHDKLWPDYRADRINADNPHNQFLMVMVEFGVLGILALMAIFLSLIWSYLNTGQHPFKPLLLILPIMFMLQCLVDTHLYGVPSRTFFIFITTVVYHPGWAEEGRGVP